MQNGSSKLHYLWQKTGKRGLEAVMLCKNNFLIMIFRLKRVSLPHIHVCERIYTGAYAYKLYDEKEHRKR